MGRSVPPAIQKVNDVNETSKKANGRNGKGREGPTWPPARIPINAKNYYSRPRRNLRAEENVGLGVHGHTGGTERGAKELSRSLGNRVCMLSGRVTDGDNNADPKSTLSF